MGWLVKHSRQNGVTTYTACYRDLRGKVQTAGTFTNEKKADKAWQRAEARQREGRVADPRLGRPTFERFVEASLPKHIVEPSTRAGYRYCLQAHITPWFRVMRMAEILP